MKSENGFTLKHPPCQWLQFGRRGTPPAQQGNLATRVLRRLRSLPLFNRRPTPPQWRSVRDRTPTPHPFDGSGGLSIATASSDGQIVGPGIWTPIAAPGAAGTASTSAGAGSGSGSGSGARRGSGLTTSAFTTPLSNPSPRQLALEPDADDLERLRIALESQRQRAEEEEEGEGVADADADLEGDTVLDMDEIPPWSSTKMASSTAPPWSRVVPTLQRGYCYLLQTRMGTRKAPPDLRREAEGAHPHASGLGCYAGCAVAFGEPRLAGTPSII